MIPERIEIEIEIVPARDPLEFSLFIRPPDLSSILALETSTEYCSVALWRGGDIFARRLKAGQTHSSHILPMVTEVLKEAGLALSDCDALAFGAGPGSFTGLRIACAVAQGLGYGADLPVVGVGGLLAMAEQLRQRHCRGFVDGTAVLSALDARMGEIYWSLLEWRDSEWIELRAPGLDFPHDLGARLAGSFGPSRESRESILHYGCGNAFQVYRAELSRYVGSVADIEVPDAEWIARLAARRIERERQGAASHPADAAAPLYVRERIALTTDERGRGERLLQRAHSR